MSPGQLHESMYIPRVNVYNMSPEIIINEGKQITELQFSEKTEIKITKTQKYKFQKYGNTSNKNTEIQMTEIHKQK